jgi:hypothetical protein
MLHHAPTLTCQFIRAARNLLAHACPWDEALPRFELRLDRYL